MQWSESPLEKGCFPMKREKNKNPATWRGGVVRGNLADFLYELCEDFWIFHRQL